MSLKLNKEEVLEDFYKALKDLKKNNLSSHKLLKGSSEIMFSAPHFVAHTRDGKLRKAEIQTGPICKLLNSYKKCPVIIKTSNKNDDANYDENSPYKEDLKNYINKKNIKILFDIHQMSYRRKTMINIGVGGFKNIDNMDILQILISVFSYYKFGKIQMDKPFGAKKEHTISSFIAQNCDIPCVQLEINSCLLKRGFKEENLYNFIKALCEIVDKLTVYFKKEHHSPHIICK